MKTSNRVTRFLNSIINNINSNIEEHKQIERSKFWKNFTVWTEILYESHEGWFYEWYFLGHIENKTHNWVYNYYYKILNKVTGSLELCPIYNVSWYVEN